MTNQRRVLPGKVCAVLLALWGAPHGATAQLVPPSADQLPGAMAPSQVTQSRSQPILAYRRGDEPSQVSPQSPSQKSPQQPDRPTVQRYAPPTGDVQPALHEAELPDARRLAPQSESSPTESRSLNDLVGSLPGDAPNLESFTTAGAGLGIVLGLFLLCTWLVRRGGPKHSGRLPAEVVSVLGRVQITPRHFAHLIQIGNKLVLVSVTPDSVDTITEVTDPTEVGRLFGMCASTRSHSTTAEFQNVLNQLAREPAKGFLGREAG